MTEPHDKPIIAFENARIRVRDRVVLENINWNILAGQHWVIIGPNGAGKTSLAGAVCGRLPVVGGRITYASRLKPETDIGYISFEKHRHLIAAEETAGEARYFSNGRLLPKTARDLLSDKLKSADQNGPPAGLLERLQALLLDRPIAALSMGEMRKLLLIRELLSQPRILILDEPFDGLDAPSRLEFLQLLEDLIRHNVQLIMVTHRLNELPSAVSHVLVLGQGQIAYCGSLAQLQNDDNFNRQYDHSRKRSPTIRSIPLDAHEPGAAVPLTLVRMKQVTVAYGGCTVFTNLNWTMRNGENWAVCGPNGSGKTTLLRLIAGDHPQAYANEIYLFGKRRGTGESIWEIKRRIGWVSAEFQIRYHRAITAADVVMSGFFDSVGLYRRGSASQRHAVRRWMDLVGVGDHAQTLFNRLSHGEQRRVLIARAVVKTPLLLILDEPCQGLDPAARQKVLAILELIGLQTRTNLLYVTHHEDEMLDCLTHLLSFEHHRNGTLTVLQDSSGGIGGWHAGRRSL
jgi:molybdate transport system ATP-binding protein